MLRRRLMKQKQEDEIIDLSLRDVYGNKIEQSTANCYVVRKKGKYKFPLVYGNSIKNGQINRAAFTNNGNSYCGDFVRMQGDSIVTIGENDIVWIIQSVGVFHDLQIANSDMDGSVITLHDVEMIDSESIDERKSYGVFEINDIPKEGGNIVINCTSVDGPLWHWHIWLWPHDLSPVEITNSTGVKYNIMPVNLASKYDDDMIHMKNWFYQWGRMTPLLCQESWNSKESHHAGVFSIADNEEVASFVKHPTALLKSTSSDEDSWFKDEYFKNIWDSLGGSSDKTIKTVYDPCPVGWKVPNNSVFEGLQMLSVDDAAITYARYEGDTIGFKVYFNGSRVSSYLYTSDDEVFVWASTSTIIWLQADVIVLYEGGTVVMYQTRSVGCGIRPVQDDLTEIDEL